MLETLFAGYDFLVLGTPFCGRNVGSAGPCMGVAGGRETPPPGVRGDLDLPGTEFSLLRSWELRVPPWGPCTGES